MKDKASNILKIFELKKEGKSSPYFKSVEVNLVFIQALRLRMKKSLQL